MFVLVAVVEDRLAGHTLLAPGDCGHFPHSSSGSVSDISFLYTFAVSLPSGGTLHLSGPVRVDSPEVLVLLHPTTEGVGHVIVVIVLPLALHEEAGPLDKLVHGHVGVFLPALTVDGSSHVLISPSDSVLTVHVCNSLAVSGLLARLVLAATRPHRYGARLHGAGQQFLP